MAQSQRRMVYSKIWASPQFGKLTPKAQLLFIGMITLADDDGRLVGTASYLRGQVFPYDNDMTVNDLISLRNEVVAKDLIQVYIVDEIEYIEHPKWEEYQVIRGDLYKESTLPTRNGSVTKPLQKRDVSKDKISKDKLRDTEPSASQDYLKQIPSEDLKEFTERFEVSVSGVKGKAEELSNYCTMHGKRYKNYKAFLLNALKRDFNERPPKKEASPPPKVEEEISPEEKRRVKERIEEIRNSMALKK